jgi:hypothetical protein
MSKTVHTARKNAVTRVYFFIFIRLPNSSFSYIYNTIISIIVQFLFAERTKFVYSNSILTVSKTEFIFSKEKLL